MLDVMAVSFLLDKKEKNKDNIDEGDNILESFKNKKVSYIDIFIGLLVSFLVAYLAYVCNEGSGKASQIFFTIFGLLFSGTYLLFYFIYHILMSVPCPQIVKTK